MKIAPIAIVLLGLSIGGCATSNISYDPPAQRSVVNKIDINEPFDVVWDRLVRKLSEDFFVINNIEKSSKIINVSFSSSQPYQFVDCGFTTRTFENVRGKQTFSYKAADSSSYITTGNGNIAFRVSRSTKLEGRSNIYVSPVDATKTSVSINTKYVFSVKLNLLTLDGAPGGSIPDQTVDFTTKDPGTFHLVDQNQPAVKCSANGVLEDKILRYVRGEN
ncbi:hypothetical protein [Magnetospirillum fulvum]|uniref:hypothetical protein n=1 Tax=Magnetospirillum fulvum TaxID=1082 RepID=UPI0012DE6356|nr:hypothetical protein [Magnetospirillum fulvum]